MSHTLRFVHQRKLQAHRFLTVMSLCVLSACKPSIEENTLDLSVAYDKAPVQVSYEMESISFTELVSKNTSTEFLYKIAAKPNVTHLKVYAGIFEDGTSE